MTSEIDAILNGTAAGSGFPEAEAIATNDIFLAGHMVSVSLQRGDRKARLKLVEGSDAVWSLSYRTPRPGWRLLGRFLERDVFIGLSLRSRTYLGRSASGYLNEAIAIADAWNLRLPGIDPIRSQAVEDILSPPFWDIDNEFD